MGGNRSSSNNDFRSYPATKISCQRHAHSPGISRSSLQLQHTHRDFHHLSARIWTDNDSLGFIFREHRSVANLFEDVDRVSSLVFTVLAVAVIGTVYANLGGLRAVAISDTINGIGLLFFGFLIPILALRSIGEGSVTEGWILLTNVYPEKLNAIGSGTDPTPFLTIFTGMLFANLSYWGTNQYVIQRTLAAKSLAAGQKGVLVAGFFKLLIPFFVMVPGITAFHIYGDSLGTMDAAYPALVKEVLPNYLIGLF